MAEIKMTANRTFEGTEGFIRRGDVFTVESEERADRLEELQLAERSEAGAEVTNYSQRNSELDSMTKDELKATADAENIEYNDSILKDDLKNLIIRERENQYINDQAKTTAVYNNGGTATDSGTGSTGGTAE